jgi:hypothetical protein
LFAGQHADGRGYSLKLAFSGLVRGDEDFFEDLDRQGHADGCGLAVDDSNDTSAGCETSERRGDGPVAARHGFESEASLVIRSCLQRRHPGYRDQHAGQGIAGEILDPAGDSTNALRVEVCLQQHGHQQAGGCLPRRNRTCR